MCAEKGFGLEIRGRDRDLAERSRDAEGKREEGDRDGER